MRGERIKKAGILIVKRNGRRESFDERKIYASCYAACINTSIAKRDAERLCEKVTGEIKSRLRGRGEITSQRLFESMVEILIKHNQDVAFMYETHRDIS